MHALMIPYVTIHIIMYAQELVRGQRLERAANMIIIFIAIKLTNYN